MRQSVRLRAREQHSLQEGGMRANVSFPSLRAPPANSLNLSRGDARCGKKGSAAGAHRVPADGG